MHSTRYVIFFILILTGAAAIAITGLRQATFAQATLNEEIFEKRAVLTAVSNYLGEEVSVGDLSDDEVVEIFEQQVEQRVVNIEGELMESEKADEIDTAKERKKPIENQRFPLYIFNQAGEKFYIMSVRGKGLWDEIWGYVALKSDINTVAGVSFDHKGETPGLGAEIKDNPAFPRQFQGKKIYDDDGTYVSVKVRKGGAKDPDHEVDGISGATVTADGVSKMLFQGIKYYQPYLKELKPGIQQ